VIFPDVQIVTGSPRTFFSSVRQAGGWNNNPSAKQYCAIHRALLTRTGITAGLQGNVTPQDDTVLITVPQSQAATSELFSDPLHVNWQSAFSHTLTPFIENVAEYIAGWVIRKLQKKLSCSECLVALTTSASVHNAGSSLLEIKNNGGLIIPSAGVVAVVQHAERVIRATVNTSQIENTPSWGSILELEVLQSVPSNLFAEHRQHFDNSQHGISSHYHSLIRCIVRIYVNLRRHHAVNMYNFKLRGQSVRQKLNKTVIFKNQ
jgi:hypothetical protein